MKLQRFIRKYNNCRHSKRFTYFYIKNKMEFNFNNLVRRSRSYRRFDANFKIETSVLEQLIDAARLAPSARNKQNLKFLPVNQESLLENIFPFMTWAGYLNTWHGPSKDERPGAYIVICWDKNISSSRQADYVDVNTGIAAQTILLGATSMNLAGCYIGGFHAAKLSEALTLPEYLVPLAVLAIGKPGETVVLEEMQDGNVKYWRDEANVHHTPKRSLEEIIIKLNS